jgi:hypothetical protein
MKFIAGFWLIGLFGLSYMAVQEVQATYDSTIVINHRNINDYKSSVDGVEISDLPVVSLKPRSSTKPNTTPKSNSSGGKTVVSSPQKKGWGFAEAFGGIILIWLAIPMVWMNERKDVKMDKVINQGREAAVKADHEAPEDSNEYALIHVYGETSTEQQVSDE